MSQRTPLEIATHYITIMGKKDFAGMQELYAAQIHFIGPARTLTGSAELAAANKRLGPILETTRLQKAFVDGDEVCVLYDYVTNTEEGTVFTMEWLRIEQGRIASIRLLTDHVRWPKVQAELQRRMG